MLISQTAVDRINFDGVIDGVIALGPSFYCQFYRHRLRRGVFVSIQLTVLVYAWVWATRYYNIM